MCKHGHSLIKRFFPNRYNKQTPLCINLHSHAHLETSSWGQEVRVIPVSIENTVHAATWSKTQQTRQQPFLILKPSFSTNLINHVSCSGFTINMESSSGKYFANIICNFQLNLFRASASIKSKCLKQGWPNYGPWDKCGLHIDNVRALI